MESIHKPPYREGVWDINELSEPLPPDFLVIDLETETQPDGKIKALDGNVPVLLGVAGRIRGVEEHQLSLVTNTSVLYLSPFKVLVGHNIKFDLEYIRRCGSMRIAPERDEPSVDIFYWLRTGAFVLDTQLLTYLHSGQTVRMPSLEEACSYWGIPAAKTLDLSVELPKVGHDIRKIPGLVEYLHGDLDMTARLINRILQDPWVTSNFRWILQMHDALLGTHEIEFNGHHVDPTRLHNLRTSCEIELIDLDRKFRDVALDMVRNPATVTAMSMDSNDDMGKLLFGGTLEWTEEVPNGFYKTGAKAGLPKVKKELRSISLPPRCKVMTGWISPKTGKYSVSDEVLEELLSEQLAYPVGSIQRDENVIKLLETLRKHREYSKIHGTYLAGMTQHLRVMGEKYFIFPQINTCLTATGRSSSSKPNMQNIATSDPVGVASIFTSRFGDEGTLVEVDFKQLEVLGLAVLTKDANLVRDIRAGNDIHTETGRPVFGSKMSKEERRVIKTINFGLIYGGGAFTLAKQAGVLPTVAARAIKSFYSRYPGTKTYFDGFLASIQESIDRHGLPTGVILDGKAQKCFMWESSTGRRYGFKDYPVRPSFFAVPPKGGGMEVSYTETRNYPIQGLATADVVMCALGYIWRTLLPDYGGDVKLIGLVHDSLRFDIKTCVLDRFVRELSMALEGSGNILNNVCDKTIWDLPIKVTVAVGNNFRVMKEIELTSLKEDI